MRTLTPNLIDRKNEQHAADPWLWLVAVTVATSTTATVMLRLTSFGQEVVFQTKTYRPFPLSISPLEQDDQGTLPEVILSVSNVTREAAAIVSAGRGMIGQPVELNLVHYAHIGTGDDVPSTYNIRDVTLDDQTVAVRLRLPNLLEEQWPFDVVTRDRCRFIYKDHLTCAYNGGLGPCSKTLSACRQRGDDEITQAKPKLHTRLFGGFPGATARRAS